MVLNELNSRLLAISQMKLQEAFTWSLNVYGIVKLATQWLKGQSPIGYML